MSTIEGLGEIAAGLVVCPECRAEGERSKVYRGPQFTTLVYCSPFYDEDGRLHDHDWNTRAAECACSRGHRWAERRNGECWCGWKG